jgi:hypothetical protein
MPPPAAAAAGAATQVSLYASNYVALKGHSPFARAGAGPAAGQKK